MKPITKIGLALLALALLVFAPGLSTKEVAASAPYTFDTNSGYWVGASGGYYTRSKVYYNEYCGRRCYTSWRWRYARVAQNQAYKYITPKSEGWRTQLLEIAANRDKYESSQRTSALEHSEFLEAVKALGMTGNFNMQNYGVSPQYANNAYAQQQQLANQQATQQGSTVYGYSTVADVYGDVDLGALYQQALRLGEQSQSFGAAAARDSKALIAQEGENRARIAAILAEAQAVREKLDAARPAAHTQIRTHQFRVDVPGDGGKPTVTPIVPPSSTDPKGRSSIQGLGGNPLATVISNKCIRCHGGAKTEGGLDLRDLSKLTLDQGSSVLARIVHPDPKKAMPKDAPPLSVEERLLFFQAATPQETAKED